MIFDRLLDLRIEFDRAELKLAAKDNPLLLELINEYADEAAEFLAGDQWFQVKPPGFIVIKTSDLSLQGISLDELLKFVGALRVIRNCDGFDKLIGCLSNPTQIMATIFEATTAAWCITRSVSLGVEFGPKVIVRRKEKYPDFLWKTSVGDIICECKTVDPLRGLPQQKSDRFNELVANAYNHFGPWQNLQLIVNIYSQDGNLEHMINSCAEQASAAAKSGEWQNITFSDGSVTAKFLRCDDEFVEDNNFIAVGAARIRQGGVPQRLDQTVDYRVQFSAKKLWEDKAKSSLHDARTQLPESSVNAVFLQVPHPTEPMGNKLAEILETADYKHIAFITLWDGPCFNRVIWKNGQPFNNSLITSDLTSLRRYYQPANDIIGRRLLQITDFMRLSFLKCETQRCWALYFPWLQWNSIMYVIRLTKRTDGVAQANLMFLKIIIDKPTSLQ